tara:strand:- start:12509 stop:13207 length:699 start_codon:yes stop_codon:yes gene_type:complete
MGCNSNSRNDYFFLAEYPELVFTDEQYNPIPTRFYISHMSQNGMSTYIIQDHSLTLRYRRSQEPYSGFIRTYHWGVYNIEAIFEEGKIERLRYWHPNRQLAMDMDYQTGIGSAWTSTGALAITWEGKEIQYRNITTNKIKQIKNDSLTYYFDFDGELKYYTTINDTSYVQFYADGSPRFMLPIWNKGLRTGLVRRWHPNGEIQVTGRYLDGEEFGIWIEYDSLGKEVDRVEY